MSELVAIMCPEITSFLVSFHRMAIRIRESFVMRIFFCRQGKKPRELVAVKQVSNPHPDWKPGQKQPHPFDKSQRLVLDPSELGAGLYPFVISSVVPRPIAFISSLSKEVRMHCLSLEGCCQASNHTLLWLLLLENTYIIP